MRLIVGGGRAAESPDSKGAVVVGVRTLSEGGRVGNFSREQVSLFLFLSLHKQIVFERNVKMIISSLYITACLSFSPI